MSSIAEYLLRRELLCDRKQLSDMSQVKKCTHLPETYRQSSRLPSHRQRFCRLR